MLQEVNGETLNPGSNKSADARLDVYARGFWERQIFAFFDFRVFLNRFTVCVIVYYNVMH